MLTSMVKRFLLLHLIVGTMGDGGAMTSAEDGSSPVSFIERAGVPFTEFEIKFANLRILYKMAFFPADMHVCDGAFLFVFIPTRPSSSDVRDAIRSSWVKDRPQNVVVKFIIGQPKDPELFDALLNEQRTVGDLILYDIEDNYENLYLKVHAGFNWQQAFCSHAEYVLKTDDDTVVDLNRLLYWIDKDISHQKHEHPAIVAGALLKGTKPIRSKWHKWYAPHETFPLTRFPNYANGATYLLSNEAVTTILNNTQSVHAFALEDVLYTGVISARAGVERVDVRQYFRGYDFVYSREKCLADDDTPLITAVFGDFTPSDFAKMYEDMKNAQCGHLNTLGH